MMQPIERTEIKAADSVTALTGLHRNCVLVAGSHGAMSAARHALRAGVRAVIFNDAGGGLDMAGITSLILLERLGVAAAAVSHATARIGDGTDMLSRGLVSHANSLALALGVVIGERCETAAGRLSAATPRGVIDCPPERRIALPDVAGVKVWALDSASLSSGDDVDAILVTGSHGGLLGGAPHTALRGAALCVLYNDAGVGIDHAGVSRLAALDGRAIAAATVDYRTARIGDARSTWETGIVSHINQRAFALGGRVGQSSKMLAASIAGARPPHGEASGVLATASKDLSPAV